VLASELFGWKSAFRAEVNDVGRSNIPFRKEVIINSVKRCVVIINSKSRDLFALYSIMTRQ
jgi:hypothetical protein